MWLLLPPLLIGLRVLYVVGLAMQAWSLLSWKVPESRDGAEMNELCEVDGIFQTVWSLLGCPDLLLFGWCSEVLGYVLVKFSWVAGQIKYNFAASLNCTYFFCNTCLVALFNIHNIPNNYTATYWKSNCGHLTWVWVMPVQEGGTILSQIFRDQC